MVRIPKSKPIGKAAITVLTNLRRSSLPMTSSSSLSPSTSEIAAIKLLRRRPPRMIKPLWVNAVKEGLLKPFVNGKCHLTSINYNTEAKSIARLELPKKPIQNAFVQKLSRLPTDAIEALGSLIMNAKTSPRQLQNHADELSNKLDVRHFPFPPQVVRQTRAEILKEILEEYPAFIYEYNIWKNRPHIDAELNKLVKKRLAVRRYNWKPIKFHNQQEALVYALSRFPSHFAEMKRVLAEFDRNGFVPEKILDIGSGIGSAFWAAFERWGDKVKEYALIDPDLMIRHFSMDLLRGRNLSGSGEMISRNLFFRKELFPSPKHTYDLVILHRTLIEMPSHEERVKLVEKLWKRTKRYLVIVDSSMNDAFVALMKMRDHLVTGGYDFDLERTKELLSKNGRLDQDTIELFADRQAELYKKYCRARELLPESVKIPTRLEAGYVFAPCPHDQLCPMMARKQPCKFGVKWQEFRADHRTRSTRRDGTEKGTFSFLIMEKGERPKGEEETQRPRILELSRIHHCVSCRVCTPSDGIQKFMLGKRGDKIYARIRRAVPSQLLPVKFSMIKTEAEQLHKIRQIADEKELTREDENEEMNEQKTKFNQLALLGGKEE